jgi:hypothetical protein
MGWFTKKPTEQETEAHRLQLMKQYYDYLQRKRPYPPEEISFLDMGDVQEVWQKKQKLHEEEQAQRAKEKEQERKRGRKKTRTPRARVASDGYR